MQELPDQISTSAFKGLMSWAGCRRSEEQLSIGREQFLKGREAPHRVPLGLNPKSRSKLMRLVPAA